MSLRPDELWHQADDEHPGDPAARKARYNALMEEAGYIIDVLPVRALPTVMEELLTEEERKALSADLADIAAQVQPCWRNP